MKAGTKYKPMFDAVSFITDFENGNLSDEAVIDGFQEMINSGLVWQLQGAYSRLAECLIESGKCIAVGRA